MSASLEIEITQNDIDRSMDDRSRLNKRVNPITRAIKRAVVVKDHARTEVDFYYPSLTGTGAGYIQVDWKQFALTPELKDWINTFRKAKFGMGSPCQPSTFVLHSIQ